MEIVADASVVLAVVLNEPSREWVIERTMECQLISPEVLPYEIGNALSAVAKRGRLDDNEALEALSFSRQIAVGLRSVSIGDALKLAIAQNLYAYDAYYIQCCIESSNPLISLDNRMCDAARGLGVQVVT